jgi:hypothetical protein
MIGHYSSEKMMDFWVRKVFRGSTDQGRTLYREDSVPAPDADRGFFDLLNLLFRDVEPSFGSLRVIDWQLLKTSNASES